MESELARLSKGLEKHAADDAAYQKSDGEEKVKTNARLKRLEEKMDGLATKTDIKELKDFMRQVNIGVGFLRFTWNNASKLGSMALFFVGVFLFFKYGIIGLIAWLAKGGL